MAGLTKNKANSAQIFGSKRFFGKQRFLVKKIGSKKFQVKKDFWSKKLEGGAKKWLWWVDDPEKGRQKT